MKKWLISFTLILIPQFLHSAGQVSNKAQSVVISDFSYGKQTNVVGNKVDNAGAKYIQNFFIDERTGSLYKPNGFIILGSTTGLSKCTFILTYIKPDNSVEFLVTDNSSLLSTVDFNNYKPIKLGLSNTSDLTGIEYNFKTWWSNGTDFPFTYDGSTVVVMDGNTYGSLRTPNVPKGACMIESLKSIWMGNISGAPSDIAWNTLYSTGGDRIEPDDYRAWPVTNRTSIGIGDGQSITCLKNYGGTLVAGKERSIYNRYGDSDTNFTFVKATSKIGFLSNFSAIEHENVLIGQSYDQFFAFDGQNVNSISDLIRPDFQNIRADITQTITNTWETNSDFSRGTASFTYVVNNAVSISTNFHISTIGVWNINGSFLNFGAVQSSTFTNWMSFNIASAAPIGIFTYPMNQATQKLLLWQINSPNPTNSLIARIRNLRTNITTVYKANNINGSGQVELPLDHVEGADNTIYSGVDTGWSRYNIITGDDINRSNVQIKLEDNGAGSNWNIQVPTTSGNCDLTLLAFTTGSFISDITTATNITSWKNFDSNYSLNGGNINYFYRASTSPVNISTYPWIPISPGSVITSSPTNNYIQWAATISAVDINNPTYIDNVVIGHNNGNSSITRSFAVDWNGRLYIGVSTESTGNFPIIYVKAKKTNSKNPLAWTQLVDIPIRCMVKYQNYLYAGSASTGSIYRMDYGTNYGGRAIVSIYESPDLILGSDAYFPVSAGAVSGVASAFTYKDIWEYMVDAVSNSGCTIKMGTSLDNAAFNYNTFSVGANGHTIRTINNPNGGHKTLGRMCSIRIQNDELDKDLIFNAFSITYFPTKIR